MNRLRYEPQDCGLGELPVNHGRLTTAQLVQLCLQYGIRGTIPYSQLEAEAVRRGSDLRVIVREHLIQRLTEAGIL